MNDVLDVQRSALMMTPEAWGMTFSMNVSAKLPHALFPGEEFREWIMVLRSPNIFTALVQWVLRVKQKGTRSVKCQAGSNLMVIIWYSQLCASCGIMMGREFVNSRGKIPCVQSSSHPQTSPDYVYWVGYIFYSIFVYRCAVDHARAFAIERSRKCQWRDASTKRRAKCIQLWG